MIRVACAQLAPDVDDRPASAIRALAALAEARAAGAQVIVLPELVACGYCLHDVEEARAVAEGADGPTLRSWCAALAGSDAVAIGGFAELGEDGLLYNSAALVDGDGVRAIYRKVHLWDRESLLFTPGSARAPVVQTVHGRIGVCICYDLEFPELTRGLALEGADLIAAPTNWPRTEPPAGERPMLMTLAMATAYFSRVHVAVCDRCGSERGVDFEGGSSIARPNGWFSAEAASDRGPSLLIADLDLSEARDKRTSERNDAFADRRPAQYRPHLVR
jgi:predicted amidohydrolase